MAVSKGINGRRSVDSLASRGAPASALHYAGAIEALSQLRGGVMNEGFSEQQILLIRDLADKAIPSLNKDCWI